MLRSQMARLEHRDPRHRRRAVRALFELDDPAAMSAFLPLLDDPDPWFNSKAMQAVRRWYPGDAPEAADSLAGSPQVARRRLAAEVLPRRPDVGEALTCLSRLLDDDDATVRLQAWTTRLDLRPAAEDDSIQAALSDSSAAVRRLMLTALADRDPSESLVLRALKDPNPRVASTAVAMFTSPHTEPTAAVAEQLHRLAVSGGSDELRASVACALLEQPNVDIGDLDIAAWLQPVRPAVVAAVVEGLTGTDWWSDAELVAALRAVESPALMPRLLRRSSGPGPDSLQSAMLLDESVDQFVRMRILEDLLGRTVNSATGASVRLIVEMDENPLSVLARSVLSQQRAIGIGEEE